MRRSMVVAAVAAGILLAFSAGARALTAGGMARWQIVCDPAATEAERYAATEFQALYRGMTGRTLPVVASARPGTGSVLIGPDAVRKAGAGATPASLGDEGLRIRVTPRAVAIDGGRPRGTMYGVYEFFEELCGARYLTHDHTWFPRDAAARTLPQGVRTYVPQFRFRWSYYGETSRYPEFAARLHTNTVDGGPKLGGRTGFRLVSHNVAYLVPPATYGKDHPEYYAELNGKRVLANEGGGPQLCLTNPHVQDLVVQAVLDEIEKDPTARNINIAQMDNGGYCTCPKCAAVDRREGSHAGTMLAFVNAVAARVEKTHPDVLLSTYAYQYTRKPPKTLRARRNVMIQLCSIECCDLHAIDDPACATNRTFCSDMAVWNTKCDKIFIWHYNTNFAGYMLPFPNLKAIGRSVTFFSRNHGRGVFMQAAGNGFSSEMSDLRNYVMSRCLWKPGRDSWQETLEVCKLHYAEASAPIIAYLTYYHQMVQDAGLHPGCFPTESALGIDAGSARRIFAYFQQAMKLAKSPVVRARVEKASLCAYRAALSGSSMNLAFDNGTCHPDLKGFDPNLLDRYVELANRYGVAMEAETVAVGTYVDALRKLYAGVKAERVENALWRVVALPGSNGKIVSMVYKPTGRDIVRPHRGFNRFRNEEWVRDGVGPAPGSTLAFEVTASTADRLAMAVTASDGSRFERTISLVGDAVRVEVAVTAGVERSVTLWSHPEYDTVTASESAKAVEIYGRAPNWVQINRTWKEAAPPTEDGGLMQRVKRGGVLAYYSRAAGFGVSETFDPAPMEAVGPSWMPSRRQINLELNPTPVSLTAGQRTGYAYDIRYLRKPPILP